MKIWQIITNRKTGREAKIYKVYEDGDLLIKYLKDGEPWGRLIDAKAKNFRC